MRCIAHITESLGGGVLHVLHKYVADQINRGERVFLIYSRRPDTPTEDYLDALFPKSVVRIQIAMVKEPNISKDLASVICIIKLLSSIKPDVVHAHSSKAGALARFAGLFLDTKIFYTPHGFSFARRDVSTFKRGIYWLFEALGSVLGGRIIACSPSEMLLASYLPRWRNITLVENGVDDIACKLPTLGSGKSNKVVVVSVGRLTHQKAPERFFRLARELPYIDFVWVGDGDIKPISDSWPDNLKITGWIEKSEIYGFLVNADIFCMLSHWEGMPLALLEAMLIGMPVVVSNIGGCHEVVEEGVSGFVCDNYEAAFSSLKLLTNDTSKISEMGTAARNRALNRYRSERMCDEVYKTYFN